MAKDFIEAVIDWNKRKDEFVTSQLSTGNERLAPRKNIFLTIPLEAEQEIKEFVKAKRAEIDKKFSSNIERQKIQFSISFEQENPMPHSKDFL